MNGSNMRKVQISSTTLPNKITPPPNNITPAGAWGVGVGVGGG